MKFTVATANGQITDYNGSFIVSDDGLLRISPEGGNRIIMSPAGWVALEVTEESSNTGAAFI